MKSYKLNDMKILPKATLKLMRGAMGKAWRSRLADEAEFSETYCWQIMNGKKHDEKVITAARKLIRKEKERLESEAKKMESLANEIGDEINK